MKDKASNSGKTIKDAAKAWNEVRLMQGPRDYASYKVRKNNDK